MRICCACGSPGPGLERAGEQRGPGGRGWIPTYGCSNVYACLERVKAQSTATPRTVQLGGPTVQGA